MWANLLDERTSRNGALYRVTNSWTTRDYVEQYTVLERYRERGRYRRTEAYG